MYEFKLHLKSGQTVTWKCEGKKRAKHVQKDLKLLLPKQKYVKQDIIQLGRKSKGESVLRFLPGELIGYEVKAPTENRFFVKEVTTNGGALSENQIEVIAKNIMNMNEKEKKKNGEETD